MQNALEAQRSAADLEVREKLLCLFLRVSVFFVSFALEAVRSAADLEVWEKLAGLDGEEELLQAEVGTAHKPHDI